MYFNKRAFLHNCKATDFVSWTCKIRQEDVLCHIYACRSRDSTRLGLETDLLWGRQDPCSDLTEETEEEELWVYVSFKKIKK